MIAITAISLLKALRLLPWLIKPDKHGQDHLEPLRWLCTGLPCLPAFGSAAQRCLHKVSRGPSGWESAAHHTGSILVWHECSSLYPWRPSSLSNSTHKTKVRSPVILSMLLEGLGDGGRCKNDASKVGCY